MSDDEPYSIHRQAGMDEADAVTALMKMDRENRVAAIRRLYEEAGNAEFQEALFRKKYHAKGEPRHVD